MAVTKAKKSSKALLALSSAAIALHGINAKAESPVAAPKLTTQFGYYQEEGDRMKAQVYHGEFVVPVKDWLELSFSFDQDTYVGASPYFTVPHGASDTISAASNIDPFSLAINVVAANADVKDGVFDDIINGVIPPTNINTETIRRIIHTQSLNYSAKPVTKMAEHPLETRNMPILGGKIFLGPVTLGFSGGISTEPDFESTFGGVNLSWELNNKLTTLNAGFNVANNDVFREAVATGAGPHDHSEGELEDFEASNTYRTFSLGVSQVMGKNTLFHLNTSYIRQRGYLSNPYKLVNITGELTAEDYNEAGFVGGVGSTWDAFTDLEVAGFELFREVRPEKRDVLVVAAGLNQYMPKLDATVHADYRFFMDNWGINSHTFELSWYQDLPLGLTVTPSIRYYSQSGADFFAPFFRSPRKDGYYSSDYRLSGYGTLTGGVAISKQFAKGVRLDVGFEYSTHKGSLKLGGDGVGDYADIDSYLISAALEVDLSNLGRAIGGHNHHDMHVEHSAHSPAGVMFGHMLDKAGDMMVGYNYMFSDWSDGMQHGTSTGISDQQLISSACGAAGECTFKPERMVMHMHMFNFMYAATDWLNLMVMPQFSYMKMEMAPLPSSTATEGGEHLAVGLGDTVFGGLVKLFDSEGHHAHMGLMFSAPTGRIDITYDSFAAKDDNIVQSFGMQLGSGTWDFRPSLTYMGNSGRWSWGAQITGVKRMQRKNKFGYALGDEIQGSVWGGYKAFNWLSFSVRNIYKVQGTIKGKLNREIPLALGQDPDPVPMENTSNYGGRFWDIGLGVNFSVPGGVYSGHSLGVEWLQPVIHDFNGYQLERNGTLSVRWGYMF